MESGTRVPTANRRQARSQVDRIDDADHDRADRRLRVAEDLPGAVAFVEHEHPLADARVDGGHGDQIAARRRAGRVQAIDHQQPPIVVIGGG